MPEGNPLPLDLTGQHFLYSEQEIQSARGVSLPHPLVFYQCQYEIPWHCSSGSPHTPQNEPVLILGQKHNGAPSQQLPPGPRGQVAHGQPQY